MAKKASRGFFIFYVSVDNVPPEQFSAYIEDLSENVFKHFGVEDGWNEHCLIIPIRNENSRVEVIYNNPSDPFDPELIQKLQDDISKRMEEHFPKKSEVIDNRDEIILELNSFKLQVQDLNFWQRLKFAFTNNF